MAPQGKRSRPGASPSTDFQGRRTSVCLCRKRRGGCPHPPVFDKAAHTTRREGAGGHKGRPYGQAYPPLAL
ncbi:hypothetical protein K200098A10_07120 [Flavonifractor plautii]